ncbi:MAG TPA: cyclase family protein [Gemmatimonadaceae bacterium]|nr:cyclase family protein [Gemmatimonadaceae bacterium]
MNTGPARLIDISVLTGIGTPEWPGDTPFTCGWSWSIAGGDNVNVSSITTSPHVGTHADAPLHVRDGWPGADALPLDAFAGPCTVASIDPEADLLSLDGLPPWSADRTPERLLLRTARSIAQGGFPERWPALHPDTAAALAARGLRLLGVDAPSVDPRESSDLRVHHVLFAAGAYILENLDLRAVEDGDYLLTAYPLRLAGVDAAPVRAVLERR